MEIKQTRNGMEKIRFLVFEDCRSLPFRNVLIFSRDGSRPVEMHGPTAANVSKDLARVNCLSLS